MNNPSSVLPQALAKVDNTNAAQTAASAAAQAYASGEKPSLYMNDDGVCCSSVFLSQV